MRSGKGGGFRKEGDGGEGEKEGKKDAQKVLRKSMRLFTYNLRSFCLLRAVPVVVFIVDALGFWGARESRSHDRALSAPRHCSDAHSNDRKKAWRVPTEHLSRERQSWARKTQNRNVQIRNLAVSVYCSSYFAYGRGPVSKRRPNRFSTVSKRDQTDFPQQANKTKQNFNCK